MDGTYGHCVMQSKPGSEMHDMCFIFPDASRILKNNSIVERALFRKKEAAGSSKHLVQEGLVRSK